MTYWLSHFVLHTTLLYLPSFQNSALLRGPGAGAKDEDARNLLQHIVRRNQGLDINTFAPPPSSFPGISVQLPSIFPVPSPPLQVPVIPGPPPTPQFPGQEGFGTLVLTPTLSVTLPSIFPVPGPAGPQIPVIPGPPPTPQFPGQEGFGTLVLTPTLSVTLPSIFPVPGPPGPQLPAIPGPPLPPLLPGQEGFGTLVVTP
jgi:hypothetical protein